MAAGAPESELDGFDPMLFPGAEDIDLVVDAMGNLPGELGVADEFSMSRNDENHKFGRLQGLEGD